MLKCQLASNWLILPNVSRQARKIKLISWCFEPSQPQRIYIRAEHKLHSISKLFFSQGIIPQAFFFSFFSFFLCFFLFFQPRLFIFRRHSTREPASGRVTHFILRAHTGTMCQPQPKQEKSGEVLEKMRVNGPEGRNRQGRNP